MGHSVAARRGRETITLPDVGRFRIGIQTQVAAANAPLPPSVVQQGCALVGHNVGRSASLDYRILRASAIESHMSEHAVTDHGPSDFRG